ncbi:uncharacterized protein JCM10292_006357 [Rhodotorula paludigena]|uniref:uncharacterized protein n=1 Tax=Rhodotorula paludigena TaxID=86838 RepID=UPI00316EC1DE
MVARDPFPANPAASAAHAHLLVLFPSADPGFIASCITHWLSRGPPAQAAGQPAPQRWTAEALVEHVSDKLVDVVPAGEYPQRAPRLPAQPAPGSDGAQGSAIAAMEPIRRAFGRRSRLARRTEDEAVHLKREDRVDMSGRDDLTLARNLAMIRLHALFPLVPIADLRDLVLSLDHSILFRAAETLIERSQMPARPAQPVFGVELLEVAANAFSRWFGIGGAGGAKKARTSRKGKEKVDDAAGDEVGDPVLTPHDLFRSPAHNAALVAHFEALFPALVPSTSSIRHSETVVARVVVQEGGSYAKMRDRLEHAAAEAEDARERPWWSRLVSISPAPSGSEKQRPHLGERRRSGASTAEKKELHPLVRREVEEYYSGREGRRQTRHGTSERPEPEANADVPTADCQCCFSPTPFLPSHLAYCSDPTAAVQGFSPIPPDLYAPPHVFCRDCVASYAGTFTFGGAALPPSALASFALPCISATGSTPCARIFSRAELARSLDDEMFDALSSRITATTLEQLVLPARRSDSRHSGLVRCPFCSYAELADPVPGPLMRVFCPAWVQEPFPPSPLNVLLSLIGSLALAVLILALSLCAFCFPSRGLERTYRSLYPPAPPAADTDDADAAAAVADAPAFNLLTLPERLFLSPSHLFPLCAAYLRVQVVERLLRAKEGRGTVFRCRNDGTASALGARDPTAKEVRTTSAWLARCEGVQELSWADEDDAVADKDGLGVEERRRERLIELVWGANWSARADSSGKVGAETGACGKLSCLLCSAAVNPSAPSLHRCHTSAKAASSAPASEQEQAEESLRLAVERAMSDAVKRDCGRCGAALQKQLGQGACNKVVCRCGFAYCHYCQRDIPSWEGYAHFCRHPRNPSAVGCAQCDKCDLWKEPDEGEKVRRAVARARQRWADEHPAWAKKVKLDTRVSFQPDLPEVPLFEAVLRKYDAVAEAVVRFLLQ